MRTCIQPAAIPTVLMLVRSPCYARVLLAAAAFTLLPGAVQAQQPKADPWEQARYEITQRLRKEIAEAATREMFGTGTTSISADVARAGAEWKERVLKPMTAAARTCSDWQNVLGEHIALEREMQLLGTGTQGSEPFASGTELRSLYDHAWEICYEEAYRKCVDGHDLGQLAVMLGYERNAQLLGAAEEFDPRLEKCATFELEFESRIDFNMELDGDPLLHVPVHARSRARFSLFGQEGEGELASEKVDVTLDDRPVSGEVFSCSNTVSDASTSPLRILAVDGALKPAPVNSAGDATGKAEVTELKLTINPGRMHGMLAARCQHRYEDGTVERYPAVRFPLERIWPNLLQAAHEEQRAGDGIVFDFSQARGEIPGGTLFARRSYTRKIPWEDESLIDERTVLTVWHRPQ
jgi:hypothetical protein